MPLNIAIIGAGIAGPTAAIRLSRNGHKVTIYERMQQKEGSEVGYAFRIMPNSDYCLQRIGINTVEGGAVPANLTRMFDGQGKLIVEHRENAGDGSEGKGTSVFAYRPQLHKQLMDAAAAEGVSTKWGVKVVSVDPETTTIEFSDGSKISADLIIASDGVHSCARKVVLGDSNIKPKGTTGHNAYRYMIPTSVAKEDPVLSTIVKDDSHMFSWADGDKRVLVYPVDYGRMLNITATHPEELSDRYAKATNLGAEIAYDQKAPQEAVFATYEDMDPRINALLKLADPAGLRVWKMLDMDEVPRWSLKNTVLIGDACHPVTPFGFSGASMSIEDALCLATLLSRGVSVGDVSSRLGMYEEIRKGRVGRVRDAGRIFAKGGDDKAFMIDYRKFLSNYDVVDDTERFMAGKGI